MAHSVTHSLVLREDISDAVLALIDAGTGVGKIKLQTSSSATKATLDFVDPAGAVNGTNGVLTFDCTPVLSDTSVSSGTVTQAIIEDDSTVTVLTCTVGIGTSFDINLTNNVFATGDTVQISALTYTPPT